MKAAHAAFVLVLLAPLAAAGQDLSAKAAKAITDAAPALLQRHDEVALAVVLIENRAVSWSGQFGLADPQARRAADEQTIFQFGSMSKPLAAWAVMTLVQQGKLRLDTPVNDSLRRWKLPSTAAFDAAGVTVERLLRHAAGLNVPSVNGVDVDSTLPTLLDELQGRGPTRAALAIVATPGEKFAYSGGGYGLLQLLVEDVTGRTFDDYCRDAIFKPLGMTSATFAPTGDALARAATPCAAPGRPWPQRVYPNQAAAGLYATPRDYAKFLLAHCVRDDDDAATAPVLTPTTLDLMFRPSKATPRYGLGYQLHDPVNNHPVIAHTGSNRGWRSAFVLLPAEGLGIIVAGNCDGARSRDAVVAIWRDLVNDHVRAQPAPRRDG